MNDALKHLKPDDNFQLLYATAGDLLSALKVLQQSLDPFFKEKKNCRVTALSTMPELKENKFNPSSPIYSVSVCCAITWDNDEASAEIKFLQDKYKRENT